MSAFVTKSEIYEKLPYMTEEFYALSAYFAQALGEKPNPMISPIILAGVMDDLEKGSCGFARKIDYPEIFHTRKEFVLSELPNLAYFMDAFLPEGADTFREILLTTMHWDVPRLKHVKFFGNVPENIWVATEWWLQQIQHPRMDNGEPEMAIFTARFSIGCRAKPTDAEVERFVELFVKKLSAALDIQTEVELRVDYFPWDEILASVEEELKFGQFVWPCKTVMLVSKDYVKVSLGYGADWKTIWSAK